jgi:hypothetical protein
MTALMLMLAGLSRAIKFNLIGVLFGADILLSIAIPFHYANILRVLRSRHTRMIFILMALWFFGAVLTDVYRGTVPEDYSRGWAKIIFFAMSLLSLLLVTRYDIAKLASFFAGIAFSLILEVYAFPSDLMLLDTWKFGYSQGITPLVVIIACSTPFYRAFGLTGATVALFSIGTVNLLFNFRSMFGMAVAAGLMCMVKATLDLRPVMRERLSLSSFSALLLLGALSAWGITSMYAGAASSGLLGLEAKEKYEFQSKGDLGLLLSGRVESLVSTRAIADSPILGHGSWAKDVAYIAILVDILESNGAQLAGNPYENALIPTHSYLLGSWVEAGVLGGLFWIAVTVLSLIALFKSFKGDAQYFPLASFFLLFLCWDVLFSPFGADQRFTAASRICLALCLCQSKQTEATYASNLPRVLP